MTDPLAEPPAVNPAPLPAPAVEAPGSADLHGRWRLGAAWIAAGFIALVWLKAGTRVDRKTGELIAPGVILPFTFLTLAVVTWAVVETRHWCRQR